MAFLAFNRVPHGSGSNAPTSLENGLQVVMILELDSGY